MARYKLIGNELVDINNRNRNEIMSDAYRIAKNRDNLLSQINNRTTNENVLGYNYSRNSKKNKGYLKKGAFNDGYQWGDIAKTIGSSVMDAGLNISKGISEIGESTGKVIASGVSQVADWIGKDDYAKKVRNRISGQDENINNRLITSKINDLNKKVEKNSVFDEKSDNIANSLGYLAGMTGLQSVGVPWQATAGVTSVGNELQNAYSNNAKDLDAWLSAGISAVSEIGSEYLFSGVKLPGTGKATETLIGSVTEKIKSKALKYSLELATQIGGEGLEEVISGFGSAIGQKLTYMSDKELKEIYSSDQAMEDFIAGALVSAIATGVNPKTYQDIKTGRSLLTENTPEEAKIKKIVDSSVNSNIPIKNENLNKSEQKIASNYIISQINEYQQLKNDNKITRQQEYYLNKLEQKLNELQNTNTHTESSSPTRKILPTVQDVVNQEQTTKNTSINLPVDNQQSIISNMNNANSEVPSSNKAILPTINDFNGSNINMPTSNIKVDMTKIKPEILEDIKGFKLGDPNIESYKGSYIKTMLNEVGIKVPNAMNYVSEVRPDMSFTTTKDLTRQQYVSIGNALQKLKSVDVTSVNNANYSIPIGNYQYVKSSNANINELRRTASRYLNNTARSNNTIRLLENIIKDRNYIIRFNPNITNEQGIPVNGLITKENGKTIIELNPNADNYVEFLVVHEITHDIATKEMKELILDYAKQDPEFEKSLESLKERYKTNDVSDEVVADVCGELFGNREFIQSVVEKKPNIFKKILNNIRKLAEKIKDTGANEYVSFVEKLKSMWEDAYYSNRSNLNETKYMMTSIKGMKNGIKVNNKYQDIKNRYDFALKLENTDNYTNEDIRKKTGWFKDNKGNWKFEISDTNTYIIKNPIKNTNYNLSDIFEAKTLYEMYPDLKKVSVNFVDIKGNASYNSRTKTIKVSNKLINNNDSLRGTLLHEIQHYIQNEENLPTGTTILFGNEQYANNLGEIEAADTKNRRNLTVEKRKKSIPESAKLNPTHPNRDAILNHKRNNIEKIAEKLYNLFGDKANEIFEENDIETTKENLSKNMENYSDGLGIRRRYDVEELDNSSFLLKNNEGNNDVSKKYSQNTKEWNEYLKDTFPSSGTKTKMSAIKLPIREDIKIDSKKSGILNPNEISKLTKEDANTTPILPKRGSINKVNDGNSHFAKNIKDKVNMLNVEQKAEILSKEDVRYYDKVTNKESLAMAFKKINDGGSSETLRWVKQDSKNANATDVAEGWILLKQYADNGDYDSMVEVAKKMREIGTTAGQTVQAFNIMERMTPEGMVKYAQSELSEAYDRMVKNKSKEWIDKYREDFDLKPDEVKFIMDTMQEVQNMEDGYDKRVKLAEIQKLMTDKLPPEKGAKIKSWMRISMLFNPKTQVRNVAGNALIMPVNSFGDLFSSYADKLIAKKTGVRTIGNTNIKAMLKGIKKGAYEATNDYKKGINTKDMDGNRFEISNSKSFSEKNLIGRTLNRTESLLNYIMDVGDRVFSEAAFENSLQNQMVLNNTTEITQEMMDIAHQEALSRTWNDNNNYTRFVLGVRKGLNKLNVNGYGLGDVMIPFAKTPANLTKAIIDYSPVGLVSAINKGINLKRALTNGQYTATMQHEFVQNLGKATAGTMLYILGIALAKSGITSGASDDDKDTANFLKNTLGINSYSIKIGGKSFTYDWAQPLAAPLSITANVVNSKNSDSKALLEGIVGSLDTAGSILLEQSFLQSINDVLSDNDGVVSGIINEVLQLPARAVPTFSKQIADLVDGTQRTSFEYGKPIQSAVNSIKVKIPFVSKTLNPTIDTMGREIQKYGGKNNIFNVFLNPANVSTKNISESAKEIYRIYKITGDQTIMPRVAPYYINKNGEKIILEGKDRTEYQKVSGKIIEENVNELLKDSNYKKLTDVEKAEIINKIVNYSYNKARKEVLGIEMSNEYNKINSYVNDGGTASNYYMNKKEIDYSYNNPKKYKTITQVTSYNNYLSYKDDIDKIKEKYDNFSQRKIEVIKYVNSLNLSIPQKAILIKMNYSSYNNYNSQIINYLNKQNISLEDKKAILEELGFKVRNGKVYTK